jgi:sugar lactone lactonase YvrE
VEVKFQVHSDGLALDKKGGYLYYQALTGRSLYRIKTQHLNNHSLSEKELGNYVEFVGKSGASDAIVFGSDDYVYLTSIEHNAIRRIRAGETVKTVVQDSLLKWPDSFSISPDGTIYLTTSQLHLGAAITEPYRIFKLEAGKDN